MVFVKYKRNNRLCEGKLSEAAFLRQVAKLNYHPERFGYEFIFAYLEHDDKFISWNRKDKWREHRRG